VVNAQGSAGQHLADQLFQSLVRGSNALDAPTLANTVKDAYGALAGQLLLVPAEAGSIDSLNWDDLGNGWNMPGAGDSTVLMGRRDRRDVPVVVHQTTTTPATVQHDAVDQAALDQYFAEAADGMQQSPEEEQGECP